MNAPGDCVLKLSEESVRPAGCPHNWALTQAWRDVSFQLCFTVRDLDFFMESAFNMSSWCFTELLFGVIVQLIL